MTNLLGVGVIPPFGFNMGPIAPHGLPIYIDRSIEGLRKARRDIGEIASDVGENYMDAYSRHSGLAAPIYGAGNALLGLERPAADLWDAISGSSRLPWDPPHAENGNDLDRRLVFGSMDNSSAPDLRVSLPEGSLLQNAPNPLAAALANGQSIQRTQPFGFGIISNQYP
jgi:hypothetical protein